MKPVLQLTAALQKQEEKPAKPDATSLADLQMDRCADQEATRRALCMSIETVHFVGVK